MQRTTRHYQQPEKVKQALKDFQPQQGWLCFQSAVVPFKKGELPDKGTILYGEVKDKKHQALHIQQNGNGGWLLTTYQQQAGDTHLVEYTQLLSLANGKSKNKNQNKGLKLKPSISRQARQL